MIELRDEIALCDILGEPYRRRPVPEPESHARTGLQPPDHLQHEELVEIRVEQGSHDRIDPERMIVNPGR